MSGQDHVLTRKRELGLDPNPRLDGESHYGTYYRSHVCLELEMFEFLWVICSQVIAIEQIERESCGVAHEIYSINFIVALHTPFGWFLIFPREWCHTRCFC